MLPYWLLFFAWGAGAIQHQRTVAGMTRHALFWVLCVVTALMVGLRWEVGGDWGNYLRSFNLIALLNFGQAVALTDPAYGGLNWLAARAGLGMVSVNMVCGAVFMLGVALFAARQPNPWLTIAVAVPYFIIVVGMGYTRQAAAIGCVLVGLSVAERQGPLRVALYVLVGALFHKSAALALPLIASGLLRRNVLLAIIGLAASVVVYVLVLRSASDNLITQYATSDYQSGGAGVRVAINVLAAATFLFFRKRMNFTPFESAYWAASSILSVLCVPALIALSSSVGVDRLALFLIPLQMAVFGRLPYATSRTDRPNGQVTIGVLLYSATVLIVWLNAGAMTHRWLPYRAAPFVAEG